MRLLIILACLAFIATLLLGPYNGTPPERNRTHVSLAAIKSGLEQYHEKFGRYPVSAPKPELHRGTFNGVAMDWHRAAMLYQAITGDGNNFLAPQSGRPVTESNGKIDPDEIANVVNSNLPPQMIFSGGKRPGETGRRVLVDGFGRPFQYTVGGTTEAVNSDYDLWSYGDVKSGTVRDDIDTKKSATATAAWMKNW